MKLSVASTNLLRIVVLTALLLGGVGTATAAAVSSVSQGYPTDRSSLATGTLMDLSSDAQNVEPATNSRAPELIGVVANQSLLALNDGKHKVQVVVSGPADALVSDINGEVKAGDRITTSPIAGIGMKATDAGQIVGTSQNNLTDNRTGTQTVTDKSGKSRTINLGLVALQVNVSYYSGSDQSGLAAVLPPFMLHAANGIAGHEVSPVRVLIGLLALLLGFVIAAVMLQAAVRSGIIAMGRNPLAHRALHRELIDVCVTAVGILLLTLLLVYVTLKI